MTEQLPISITLSEQLISVCPNNITSAVIRLEAQLNFQTMLANWYGDEESLINIELILLDSEGFITTKSSLVDLAKAKQFSDDVLFIANNLSLLSCYIAITESELVLLTEQPKLSTPFLQAKLTKVLTLIAKQQNFPELTV